MECLDDITLMRMDGVIGVVIFTYSFSCNGCAFNLVCGTKKYLE